MATNIVSDTPATSAAGDLSNSAFDLWALLNSTHARVLLMHETGEVQEESAAELSRGLRMAAHIANDIGEHAIDLPI